MPERIKVAGLKNIGKIYHNLSYDELIDHELKNGECVMTDSGATAVDTGVFTGRSPKDKYFVDHGDAHKYVAWGSFSKSSSVTFWLMLPQATYLWASP